MAAEVSIIIVNWNGRDLLRRCLESISSSPFDLTYEVIVIDNASQDNSLELLRKSQASSRLIDEGRLKIVENAENRGFGAANNQAFDLAQSPLIFLLNPDTELLPDAPNQLIKTIRSDRRIGACGPRILNPDGSLQISVWHAPPKAWQILLSNLKLYRLLPQRLRGELLLGGHWRHDRRRPVPMLSGAAILARREMIEEVGGFDERFHVYGEDNEWCWRIRQAGWQLVFEPTATIIHHGGESVKQRWPGLEKLQVTMEASYLFEQHALPRWRLIANQLAYYLTSSLQKAWYRLSGDRRPDVELAQKIHREHLKRSRTRTNSSRPPTAKVTNVPATHED